MHPNTVMLLSDKRTKKAFSKMSPAELQDMDDHFYDVSGEEIETDVSTDLGSQVRRALSGRYRIFLKLCDDMDSGGDLSLELARFAGDLEQEPEIIAASLAIRPEDNWEWMVVEAWSWVYRHAALLNIDITEFADWCADQDPHTSRAFLMAEKQGLGWAATHTGANAAAAVANRNA